MLDKKTRKKKKEDTLVFPFGENKKAEKKDPEIAVRQIDVDLIVQNPNQPRKNFNKEKLEELVKSIEAEGILQPIVVRGRADGRFEIVFGERRFRAALHLGYSSVPAIVREGVSDREGLIMAIVENIQRDDLNPMEEAVAYHSLIENDGMTQEELARLIGKSRVAIANTLRLNKLPEHVKSMLNQGKLTEGHARAVLLLKTPELQSQLCDKIVAEELSVRESEKIAARVSGGVSRETSRVMETDSHFSEIEDLLAKSLGMVVNIRLKKRKSKIEIICPSQSDLERIINKLISN